MAPELDKLTTLLSLERLEDRLFRGQSHNVGTNRVYGGQVLGQAIQAAQYTIEKGFVHSIHAYFLRMGDHEAPIIYEVENSRDGRSFSARRVIAIQHGKPIFTLSASFHIKEQGELEHQDPMPSVPQPDTLEDIREHLGKIEELPKKFQLGKHIFAAFDFRPVEIIDLTNPQKTEPERHIWLKTSIPLPDSPDMHAAILAYISDFSLLDTNLLPHDVKLLDKTVQLASIDHSMWFHREFRADKWLLYKSIGISASGSRGLSRGHFYDMEGRLVATTMQEGLLRLKKD
jgi:acyl-CoA thioesterase-2